MDGTVWNLLSREEMMARLRQCGNELRYASNKLCTDREIVKCAVKQNGDALFYASDELRADREIVESAVKQDGWALRYASAELRDDRQIVYSQERRQTKWMCFKIRINWFQKWWGIFVGMLGRERKGRKLAWTFYFQILFKRDTSKTTWGSEIFGAFQAHGHNASSDMTNHKRKNKIKAMRYDYWWTVYLQNITEKDFFKRQIFVLANKIKILKRCKKKARCVDFFLLLNLQHL